MAQTVSFDFKNAKAMATDADIAAIKDQVVAAKATLVNKTGEGNDFLGWIDLPESRRQQLRSRQIQTCL